MEERETNWAKGSVVGTGTVDIISRTELREQNTYDSAKYRLVRKLVKFGKTSPIGQRCVL